MALRAVLVAASMTVPVTAPSAAQKAPFDRGYGSDKVFSRWTSISRTLASEALDCDSAKKTRAAREEKTGFMPILVMGTKATFVLERWRSILKGIDGQLFGLAFRQ